MSDIVCSQHKKTQQQLKEALSASEKAGLNIKDLKREVGVLQHSPNMLTGLRKLGGKPRIVTYGVLFCALL